jgi:hypothetical protein
MPPTGPGCPQVEAAHALAPALLGAEVNRLKAAVEEGGIPAPCRARLRAEIQGLLKVRCHLGVPQFRRRLGWLNDQHMTMASVIALPALTICSCIPVSHPFSSRLLQKVLEHQKAAAATTRARAIAAAVDAGDAAVAAGQRFLVTRMDVGLDPKALQVGICFGGPPEQAELTCAQHARHALRTRGYVAFPRSVVRHSQEAFNAIQKKHPSLPVMFIATGEDKVLSWAGVPQDLSTKLPAGPRGRQLLPQG